MASNDAFNPNPFTLVFDAIWSLFEQSPVFVADVKVRNRIKLNITNDPAPLKQQINDSDLPELILTSTGASTVGLFTTSATSKIIKQYSLLLSTGDFRVNNYLNQIQWDILCCFTGWQQLLSSLIWPLNSGRTFVKRADLVNCSEGLEDPARNRGINGWSSIWTCEVEMHFVTSDLANYRGY